MFLSDANHIFLHNVNFICIYAMPNIPVTKFVACNFSRHNYLFCKNVLEWHVCPNVKKIYVLASNYVWGIDHHKNIFHDFWTDPYQRKVILYKNLFNFLQFFKNLKLFLLLLYLKKKRKKCIYKRKRKKEKKMASQDCLN